jgi:hypothetical protein
LPRPIEQVGKRGLDRDSEYPVNEDGEEILSNALPRTENNARENGDARNDVRASRDLSRKEE